MAHAHNHSPASQNKKKLAIIFGITFLYLIAEVAGGLWTHSLALLADAGHMLTDVGGLGLALFAIKLAEKPATPEKTYGYYRAEILAALVNAVVLIGISLFILYESYQRFLHPPEIQSRTMLIVACFGLVVNIVGAFLLKEASTQSLNMKGAYFEVLSDLLTSVGVIIAAVIMWTTGWYYADPLISAGIGLFILPRTWILLKDAVGILLEGTPSDVSLGAIRSSLISLPGVETIHDLHVWGLTSGVNAMSVHAVLKDGASHDEVLSFIQKECSTNFKISHITVQIERTGCLESETHL